MIDQSQTTTAHVEQQRPQAIGNLDDGPYLDYLVKVQRRFDFAVNGGKTPLFTTDANAANEVFAAYLDAFEPSVKQHHNCSACRRFVEAYGTLVIIDPVTGRTTSAVFDEEDCDDLYREPVRAILKHVKRAEVTGVFLSSSSIWGHPVTQQWCHLSVQAPTTYGHVLLTAGQAMAAKREDHNTVARALADYSQANLDTALQLLRTDSLYRSEKVLGPVEWLRDLQFARAAAHGNLRDNILWRAIATAPEGFCHPKSSMTGTLLDDIASSMDYETVSRRFAAKMAPLQYQRPQAAPSAGNIARAESIFATLGLERSLHRRFARLEDIVAVWKPPATEQNAPPATGVFAHLKPKETPSARSSNLIIPPLTMTWMKFQRDVLPGATKIELHAPAVGGYGALVTAEHADAPPILQWDLPEQRNPVSHYVYHGGSHAEQWKVRAGVLTPVTAITTTPAHWHSDKFKHHGNTLMFVLAGAVDTRKGGLALFPEDLKSELREVASVIEAFSKSRQLTGAEEASACGYMLAGKSFNKIPIRVTAGDSTGTYILDRWE